MKPDPQDSVPFETDNRNKFVVEIDTQWKINTPVKLKIEYQLYEYLCKIQKGNWLRQMTVTTTCRSANSSAIW